MAKSKDPPKVSRLPFRRDYSQCTTLQEVVRMSRVNVNNRGSGASYSTGCAPWAVQDTMERQRDQIARLRADLTDTRKRLLRYRNLPAWQQLMSQFEKGDAGTNPDKPGIYLALRPSTGEWLPTRWDGVEWMTAIAENIEEWAHL